MEKVITLDEKKSAQLRGYIEQLNAIETIEYHNMNWLPNWAIKSPKKLNEEKRRIIEMALQLIGTSSSNTLT